MPSPVGDGSGWEDAVLQGLRVPVIARSSLALSLWAQSEGMPSWANNWLATEKAGYGGRVYNSAGVYAYPTFAEGVAATVATLKQRNMASIVSAFATPIDLATIYQAINASPWCKSCQKGRYPIALYSYIVSVSGGGVVAAGLAGVPVQQPTSTPALDWSTMIHATAGSLRTYNRDVSGYADALSRL